MSVDLTRLEQKLDHTFRDPALILRALTHASLSEVNYQRLEFLGDRVVNLTVAQWLYECFPTENEGDMAKRHTALVRAETLAVAGKHLGLDTLIQASTDQRTDTENILCDTFESVIAVLYLEAGLEHAAKIIRQLLAADMERSSLPPRDPKTALQEWSQAKGLGLPQYVVVASDGPAHDPVFEIEIRLPSYPPLTAKARSKKQAEKEAAQAFLLRHVEKG